MPHPINKLLKQLNRVEAIFIILFLSGFILTASGQGNADQIDKNRISTLIQRVQNKSKRNKGTSFSNYLSRLQYKIKNTIESEDKKKKREWVNEWYCLADGLSHCQNLLISKDGVAISDSKIKKAREKIAKKFALQNQENVPLTLELSYGLIFGYEGTGKSIWVDTNFYLRDCEVTSAVRAGETPQNDNLLLFYLDNCNVGNEAWKDYVGFMPRTTAQVWINVEDESVTKMNVYAKKEFLANQGENKPIIKIEYFRMAEGYWLFKKARLETDNKKVFPNLKDNWEYEFFDFKHLNVDVETASTKQN